MLDKVFLFCNFLQFWIKHSSLYYISSHRNCSSRKSCMNVVFTQRLAMSDTRLPSLDPKLIRQLIRPLRDTNMRARKCWQTMSCPMFFQSNCTVRSHWTRGKTSLSVVYYNKKCCIISPKTVVSICFTVVIVSMTFAIALQGKGKRWLNTRRVRMFDPISFCFASGFLIDMLVWIYTKHLQQ